MKAASPLLVAMAALLILTGLILTGLASCSIPDAGPETGSETGLAERPGSKSEESMVNRIAYINNSGDLLLINPDGTGEERLTGDVRAGLPGQSLGGVESFYWPTWANDGGRIAASRVSLSGSPGTSPGRDAVGISVQLFELSGGRMVTAFDNEIPAEVADGTPHYIYWSPDGRYLSFLAPTSQGLALLVRDYHGNGEAASIAVGAPLYYHWAADSSRIAVHSGDRVTLAGPLRLLQMEGKPAWQWTPSTFAPPRSRPTVRNWPTAG